MINLEPVVDLSRFSVLLNKKPAEAEPCKDLDPRITRLIRVLPDQGEEFANKLAFTPYSEVEFEAYAAYPAKATELDKARYDFDLPPPHVKRRTSGNDCSRSCPQANGGVSDGGG
jgi:hypothetical protein